MIKRQKFSDVRFNGMCCYCGGYPDTRDHIPSKVLLDNPYPADLHVVECCFKCNNSFSGDEVYFACLIECIICGTTEIEKLSREKIKTTLQNNARLHKILSESQIMNDGRSYFNIDEKAVENVLLKLARGHASYEASAPQFGAPSHFVYKPVDTLTEQEKEAFFSVPEITLYPEIGSRLFEQTVVHQNNSPYYHWVIVQEGSYAYLVNSQGGLFSVRMLIYEYLAVEVRWED